MRLGERLVSVDLFSAKLRLIGGPQDDKDIAARLSAPDGGKRPPRSRSLNSYHNIDPCLGSCGFLEPLLLNMPASGSSSDAMFDQNVVTRAHFDCFAMVTKRHMRMSDGTARRIDLLLVTCATHTCEFS